jgi:threonine/homoserine/homoserine lactone efflux protein
MDVFSFIIWVILVTVSGALAPGPLFFTVISHGMKSGAKGGLAFSIGHTLFEFSLVLFLAIILNFGVKQIAGESFIRLSIGIVGGLALIAFGIVQIYESVKPKTGGYQKEVKLHRVRHPLVLGLALTALNPFFIVWWLTTGLMLIEMALAIASFVGVLVMYVAHVWMDYAWLTATAYLAKRGANILGSKGYRVLVAVFGAALIGFGMYFIVSVLMT